MYLVTILSYLANTVLTNLTLRVRLVSTVTHNHKITVDSPEMMEILNKIHVVKMRTQVLELIISFMTPSALTQVSRLLNNTHFIVCRNKKKPH
jgi:hypothetical protein